MPVSPEVQKDRLRQLVATAILDLWKKETGTTAPLYIEGTLCITARNGKTTTIQVADQFPGSLPDSNEEEKPMEGISLLPNTTPVKCPDGRLMWTPFIDRGRKGELEERSDCVMRRLTNGGGRRRLVSKSDSKVKRFISYENPGKKMESEMSRETREGEGFDSRRVCREDWENVEPREGDLRGIMPPQYPSPVRDNNNNTSDEADAESPPRIGAQGDPCDRGSDDGEQSRVSEDYHGDNDDDDNDKERDYVVDNSDYNNKDYNNKDYNNKDYNNKDYNNKDYNNKNYNNKDYNNKDYTVNKDAEDVSYVKIDDADSDQDDSGVSMSIHRSQNPINSSSFMTPVRTQSQALEGRNERVFMTPLPSAVDLSKRDTEPPSSPSCFSDELKEAIQRRLLSTMNPSLMSLGLPAFNFHGYQSTPSTPNTTPFSPPASIFHRDHKFSPMTPNPAFKGWPSPISMHPTGHNTTFDLRHLTSPFSPPPHAAFMAGSPIALNAAHSSPIHPSVSSYSNSLHQMLSSKMPPPNKKPSTPHQRRVKVESRIVESGLSDVRRDLSETDVKMSLENLNQLSNVLQGNNDQNVYKCHQCNKTFLFKSKYLEHLPVHTSARPFQCHLCSRTYKYKYDLRVHLRAHLGIPTKSTVCPFCAEKFSTNKLVRQHIHEVHKEQRRIGEEQCLRSLEQMTNLTRSAGSSEDLRPDSFSSESGQLEDQSRYEEEFGGAAVDDDDDDDDDIDVLDNSCESSRPSM